LEAQKDIFNKMLQGDKLALNKLLTQYHNYLTVVGRIYLPDNQRVENLIHDVFADLWNKKDDVNICR